MKLNKRILKKIIREELKNYNIHARDYDNCIIKNFDKEYKKEKDGQIIVKIKRELECDYTPVPKQQEDTELLKTIDNLEKKYNVKGDNRRVNISKSVFDRYVKWLDAKSRINSEPVDDDVLPEESDRERKQKVFGDAWSQMMRLAKGIY